LIPIGNWPSSAGIRGGNLTLGTGAANPMLALSGWRRQKESRMTRARQPVSAPSTCSRAGRAAGTARLLKSLPSRDALAAPLRPSRPAGGPS